MRLGDSESTSEAADSFEDRKTRTHPSIRGKKRKSSTGDKIIFLDYIFRYMKCTQKIVKQLGCKGRGRSKDGSIGSLDDPPLSLAVVGLVAPVWVM